MRLIDADALMERFAEMQKTKPDKDRLEYACNFRNMGGEPSAEWFTVEDAVENSPTVDAEPVRHGRWIDTGSGQECSVCGEIQYGYDSFRNYCANCGAKMDGERKDDAID